MAGGRPTVFTNEVLQLLREAFTWGCTDVEACCYADIAPSSLYNYCQENPEFLELKNKLKEMPMMKARRIINNSLDKEDLATANRVVDRKEGQKIKQDITSAGKQINTWVINPVTTEKNG